MSKKKQMKMIMITRVKVSSFVVQMCLVVDCNIMLQHGRVFLFSLLTFSPFF